MGSVKDLVILKKPDEKETGLGRFVFSDRYSVFDWGEMPDHIADKGKSICIVSAYFFESLEKHGIKTHYIGVVENGRARKIDELNESSNTIEFKMLRVVKPKIEGNFYDYSLYKSERANFLIPLEVIYRNSLPEGSSVFKRIREGSLSLKDIGLNEMPRPGQILNQTIFDVSTKLEATDRYLTWEEAGKICSLNKEELEGIKRTTLLINNLITLETGRLGLFNEDGKVEFGFDENRNLILLDALGTLDECRFTFEGIPVSKEIARIYYRKTNWFKDVEEAKKIDKVNWKNFVKSQPPPLPEELANSISLIYKSYTNELTWRKWFDAPPLRDVLMKIKKFL